MSACLSKDSATSANSAGDNEANKTVGMSNPLLNPVVLDLIFAQLSIPELKQARLVCREWSDVGASVLGKRTFLQANKLFRSDGTNLSGPAVVTEKLVRRLAISSETSRFDPSVPSNMRAKVITKVTAEVAQQFTQELKVRFDQKQHAASFINGIRKLKTTNLRHVYLGIKIFNSWGKKSPVLKKFEVQQGSFTPFIYI
ncbi:Glucans biosynthesis protein G 2 [Folsomia candida]|uniref:Glucans biosynthesis protein G 2 n=1 Tax=Folsomia candida TaxID=158441 RepID=A0A226DKM8_FOLCA|nr:Glucans biosynthesis protein G 2 [Folsomia candida]